MGLKAVAVLALIVIVVWYLYCSQQSEGFGDEHGSIGLSKYAPALIDEINKSNIQPPQDVIPPWSNKPSETLAKFGEQYADEDDNATMSLTYNLCSKSCCSPQYPTPVGIQPDPLVCASGQEFVPSTYTCNNGWQDAGCVCMTKDQSEFLSNRGGNA